MFAHCSDCVSRLFAEGFKDKLELFNHMVWYLPATTEEEILTLHKVAFPNLDEDKVKQRMQLWRPNPCLVLWCHKRELQSSAFHRLNGQINAIHSVLQTSAIGAKCHELLVEHCKGEWPEAGLELCNPAYYYFGFKSFASIPLASRILNGLQNECAQQLRVLIESGAGTDPMTGLRKFAYASTALQPLCDGSMFDTSRLDRPFDPRSEAVSLTQSTVPTKHESMGALPLN
jgi:hypothetical protein